MYNYNQYNIYFQPNPYSQQKLNTIITLYHIDRLRIAWIFTTNYILIKISCQSLPVSSEILELAIIQ